MGCWEQARLWHWGAELKSRSVHGDGQPSLVSTGQRPAPWWGHSLLSETHHCPRPTPFHGLLTASPHTQEAPGRPPVQGPRCLPLFSASPALVPSLSGCFLTIPPRGDLFCLMSRALFIGPIIRHLILCLPCPALIVVVVVGDLWVLLWREQRSGCLQLSSVIELARDRHTVTA